jgi:hypothetical protein
LSDLIFRSTFLKIINMKKTLLLVLSVSLLASSQAQNLAGNPGFEDNVTTFTVNENDFNVLRRVAGHLDATTQTANPASDVVDVTPGMWVLRAQSTGYTRAVVTSDDKHSGLNSLHMYIKPGSTNAYNSWWNHVVQQKLGTALSATKKYKATVWVRMDDTPSNNAAINFFLGDKQSNKWMTKKYDITGGATWTKYEHIFDIPAHMALPANATSTFNWTEVVAGITMVTTMEGSLSTYAGIMIDDYTFEEYIETSLPAVNTAVKPLYVSSRNLISSIGGQLELFAVNGSLLSSVKISENESVSVNSGIFIARLVTSKSTYIQKIIVE